MSKDTDNARLKKICVPKYQIMSIANILGRKRLGCWYLDSGCSQHMIGERSFLNLKPHEEWAVFFGGIGKGKIFGIGKIGIPSLASIDNVLYVEGLKYNPLNIIQFCESGYIVFFNKDKCIVKTQDGKSFFTSRCHKNLYEIDLIYLSQ